MRVDKPHLDGALLHALPTEAQRSGLLHRKVYLQGLANPSVIKASRLVARAERCRLAGRNNHYAVQGVMQPSGGLRSRVLQLRGSNHLEIAGSCWPRAAWSRPVGPASLSAAGSLGRQPGSGRGPRETVTGSER